jgi:hypothetical protein
MEELTGRHLHLKRQMVQIFAIETARDWVFDSWVAHFLDSSEK